MIRYAASAKKEPVRKDRLPLFWGRLHAGVGSEAAVDGQDDAGDDDDLTGEIHESGED